MKVNIRFSSVCMEFFKVLVFHATICLSTGFSLFNQSNTKPGELIPLEIYILWGFWEVTVWLSRAPLKIVWGPDTLHFSLKGFFVTLRHPVLEKLEPANDRSCNILKDRFQDTKKSVLESMWACPVLIQHALGVWHQSIYVLGMPVFSYM